MDERLSNLVASERLAAADAVRLHAVFRQQSRQMVEHLLSLLEDEHGVILSRMRASGRLPEERFADLLTAIAPVQRNVSLALLQLLIDEVVELPNAKYLLSVLVPVNEQVGLAVLGMLRRGTLDPGEARKLLSAAVPLRSDRAIQVLELVNNEKLAADQAMSVMNNLIPLGSAAAERLLTAIEHGKDNLEELLAVQHALIPLGQDVSNVIHDMVAAGDLKSADVTRLASALAPLSKEMALHILEVARQGQLPSESLRTLASAMTPLCKEVASELLRLAAKHPSVVQDLAVVAKRLAPLNRDVAVKALQVAATSDIDADRLARLLSSLVPLGRERACQVLDLAAAGHFGLEDVNSLMTALIPVNREVSLQLLSMVGHSLTVEEARRIAPRTIPVNKELVFEILDYLQEGLLMATQVPELLSCLVGRGRGSIEPILRTLKAGTITGEEACELLGAIRLERKRTQARVSFGPGSLSIPAFGSRDEDDDDNEDDEDAWDNELDDIEEHLDDAKELLDEYRSTLSEAMAALRSAENQANRAARIHEKSPAWADGYSDREEALEEAAEALEEAEEQFEEAKGYLNDAHGSLDDARDSLSELIECYGPLSDVLERRTARLESRVVELDRRLDQTRTESTTEFEQESSSLRERLENLREGHFVQKTAIQRTEPARPAELDLAIGADAQVVVRHSQGPITVKPGEPGRMKVRLSAGRVKVNSGENNLELSTATDSQQAKPVRGSLYLELPPTTPLQILLATDGIDITGMCSSLTAETANGLMIARNCTGELRLTSLNGDISLLDCAPGALQVNAHNGRTDLQLLGLQGEKNEVRSFAGDITLRWSESQGLVLAMASRVGSVSCQLPLQSTEDRNEPSSGVSMSGQYQSGGPKLSLATSSGKVTVEPLT